MVKKPAESESKMVGKDLSVVNEINTENIQILKQKEQRILKEYNAAGK